MSCLEVITAEIDAVGPISFSRFIELALYDPEHGFYARGGAGRRKDFITSPEVGPLFGAVIARALDAWWLELGQPDPFTVIDAGAGPGTLAKTVYRAEPACLDALQYVAVEVSARQREHHPDNIASVSTMPATVGEGVILANELLDNLPFDVQQFDSGVGWREVRVDIDRAAGGTQLVEVLVETGFERPLVGASERLSLRLPVQRAAQDWLRAALGTLERGRLAVFDYCVPGYPAPADREWLRTFSGQDRGDSPLRQAGHQDITADVDVGALREVRAPTRERSQGIWLRQYGIDDLVAEGKAAWGRAAAAPDLAAVAMRSRVTEAEALLNPHGLGGFCVLEWEVALEA